jgi:hypothetical protein
MIRIVDLSHAGCDFSRHKSSHLDAKDPTENRFVILFSKSSTGSHDRRKTSATDWTDISWGLGAWNVRLLETSLVHTCIMVFLMRIFISKMENRPYLCNCFLVCVCICVCLCDPGRVCSHRALVHMHIHTCVYVHEN